MSRSPSLEAVYEKDLPAIWKDLPSPLLRINKQIRAEMFNLLHKSLSTLRITSHGANFDMHGLTCFITQQRPRSHNNLPNPKIEIWPPHPGQPFEISNILHLVKKLRDELRAMPQIPELKIQFVENDLAKWT